MSDSDPLVGIVLNGRYEIQRGVGGGGMAKVYVAYDNRLARTVAVKILRDGLGEDKDFASRFDREARASARLSHPNVVSVFDQGEDHGRPYIVMEYVEGCTLRRLISNEAPMSPLRALELMEPVAAALAAAHEAGLIHRDVKPENVLISERGLIKVADFGLAKAVTAQSSTAAQGLVIGTVSYIAPELVTSGTPDTRTDVYSFGIVLYEMLTGTKPHVGDTPIQVAYSHVHNSIEPPSKNVPRGGARIPDYLDALVTTAAAREPDERPRDARVLLEHVKTAKDAIKRGVGDDAGLVAHMRMTKPLSAENTAVLPVTSTKTPTESSLPILVGAKTAPPPPTEVRRKRRFLPILLSLLLVAGLAFGSWYVFLGRYIDTPDVINKSETEATAIAKKNGLTIVFTKKEHSETAPVGTVARTDPLAGAPILKAGQMSAWISLGPERFSVPDLVGISEAQAGKNLSETHLLVGDVKSEYDDKIPSGNVISSTPKVGTQVKRDTKVNLVVSKGPAPVAIPDFKGKSGKSALAKLTELGLKTKVTEENSDTVTTGDVISQTPAGVEGHRGDTVTLVVSKGPVLVKVPNVRGRSTADAKRVLESAGFNVVIKKALFGLGIVGSQDPGAGEMIPKGSTVTLTIA